MVTEKDYLGFAEQKDSDEIVVPRVCLGGVGRVCGVQAIGSRTRRDSWGIFSGRRWVGHDTICRRRWSPDVQLCSGTISTAPKDTRSGFLAPYAYIRGLSTTRFARNHQMGWT